MCTECACRSSSCDNTCNCNLCNSKCADGGEYVVSISRDDIDSSVIRSISNLGNITDWHDGQIRSVTIQNGRILVDVVNDSNVVIDGEDLDFKYLKSITKNKNGSFDIVDSKGLTNRIPAGFPTKVEYNSDNTFTLETDDGQELTVDVLSVLGSYVKCVRTNCDGDIVFEIETNKSCGACSSEEVILPLNDIGVEVDPVYTAEKNTLARNSSESDGTITLNNGDGTSITTYTNDKIDSLVDGVIIEESDPIYSGEKVQLARNSMESGGVITLNNGDGSSIQTYDRTTIDNLVDGGGIVEELDPIYNADKPLIEKNHVEDLTAGTVTLTTGAGDTSVVYNKGSVDNSLNEILAKFESVVINATNPGPVNMNGSFVKVLELDPILTSGKYRGAMRATYTGTGLREVTVSIYVNGSPIGRTDVRNVTDTQTITYQTVEPLELLEDDVVAVYVKIASGSVVDVDGVLELVVGTGSIDLTGLEKDHTESGDIVTLTNSLDEVSTVYTKAGVDSLINNHLTVEGGDGRYVRSIDVNNLYTDSDFQTYTEFAQVVDKIKNDHQDGYQLTRIGGVCSVSEFSTLHNLIINLIEKLFTTTGISSAPISWYLDETSESMGTGGMLFVTFDNDSSVYSIQYNNWEADYTTSDLSAFRATKGYFGEINSSNIYPKDISDSKFEGMVYIPVEYTNAVFSGMNMAQIFARIKVDHISGNLGSTCVTGLFSDGLFTTIKTALSDLITSMYDETAVVSSGSFTIFTPNPGGLQGGYKMTVSLNSGDSYIFDIDNYGSGYESVDADLFKPSVIHVGTLYERSPVALASSNIQMLKIQRDSEVISLDRDKLELSDTKVQVRYNELSRIISEREKLILQIDKILFNEQRVINNDNRG